MMSTTRRSTSRTEEGIAATPDERLLVATDLDGTLLDEVTYSFEPARPALDELARRGASLVLASSKTQAEMEVIGRRLGLAAALIAENGAVLLVPRGNGYKVLAGGVRRALLVEALAEIGRETGIRLRGFSSLSAEAVTSMTGLSIDAAGLALQRYYDEPFWLEDPADAPVVTQAAQRRGLAVTRGGRFFHLAGRSDKGSALRQLLARWTGGPRWHTVGLGDAANDLPLLRAVARPIVVPGSDGTVRRELRAALPAAERAPAPGPAGWNAAVLSVLEGGRLPTVGETEGD
jgi:mannosyl-3-phosphoglycerate phosphatase